jgi:lipopolysaccharide transport system ATP-binding protein
LVLVQKVSKLYRLYRRPADRLYEMLPRARQRYSEFWALRDISFQVEKGEMLGVVGPNGCGKSTLLQIVSGILQPTTGRVVTHGRIAALLELGAGFNPEFSGRENVYLNGEILGLSRAEISKAMPSIEAFAEIGEFIDRPVKEYSSGMYVRLAFSTAIHVDPEILIVDEALAVGDAVFANRCVRKFQELRERKITVLFVSHDLGLVKQLSDRAILLLGGRIAAEGAPRDVINRYIGLVLEKQRRPRPFQLPPRRWIERNSGRPPAQRQWRGRGFGCEWRARHRARTLALPPRHVGPHGGYSHPHPHRHGRLWHQHAAGAGRTRRFSGRR